MVQAPSINSSLMNNTRKNLYFEKKNGHTLGPYDGFLCQKSKVIWFSSKTALFSN